MTYLADFKYITVDKVRYADTDRRGHVNNAVFATFLETGRVEILYSRDKPVLMKGCSFVIAALNMQFIKELHWPGKVDIGTGISKLGSSSLKIKQGLFQDGHCVATAETVIVQVNDKRGGSEPLSPAAREHLSAFVLDEGKH